MTDTERLRRLDRENEELRDMLNQVAWRLGLGDEVHYYADNYLACQLRVLDAIEGLTERESDVETVRSDAMEAWRWVCDHGGLENVRDAWDEAVNLCATIGCEPNDESEMLQALGDCTDIVIKRLVPEGCEWPRYDAGEPVRIGGAIADVLGHAHEVTSVELHDAGAALHWNPAEPEECVWVGRGEPVRRPAALAADGEPLEVGQTVWHKDGTKLRVLGFKLVEDVETIVSVEYVDGPTNWSEVRSLSLTHTKPEPPDSWERIEEDATLSPEVYCHRNGIDISQKDGTEIFLADTVEPMARDLVRRCRALAERERGE